MTLSRFMLAGLAFLFDAPSTANAQEHNWLLGEWTIEETDEIDPSFSGVARVTFDTESNSYIAHLITEDTCCQGRNFAKVKQTGRVEFEADQIIIVSEIDAFLIREEELPGIRYSADDFFLRKSDSKLLVGTANGYTNVVWTKRLQAIS